MCALSDDVQKPLAQQCSSPARSVLPLDGPFEGGEWNGRGAASLSSFDMSESVCVLCLSTGRRRGGPAVCGGGGGDNAQGRRQGQGEAREGGAQAQGEGGALHSCPSVSLLSRSAGGTPTAARLSVRVGRLPSNSPPNPSSTAAQEQEEKKKLQALILSIPKEREEIFAFPVNWALFDREKMSETVAKWTAKKVQELLGQEEQSLVEFIVEKVQGHAPPSELVADLQGILVRLRCACAARAVAVVVRDLLRGRPCVRAECVERTVCFAAGGGRSAVPRLKSVLRRPASLPGRCRTTTRSRSC